MERSHCRLRGDGRGFMMKGKKGVVVSHGEKKRNCHCCCCGCCKLCDGEREVMIVVRGSHGDCCLLL